MSIERKIRKCLYCNGMTLTAMPVCPACIRHEYSGYLGGQKLTPYQSEKLYRWQQIIDEISNQNSNQNKEIVELDNNVCIRCGEKKGLHSGCGNVWGRRYMRHIYSNDRRLKENKKEKGGDNNAN